MKSNKLLMFKTKKSQSGVILVEVMIAIIIFSFGLLGLVGLQAVAAQNSTNAEERGRASMLANDLVSQMWVRQTVNLPAADVTAWKAQVADFTKIGLPNATGDVSVSGDLATITVQWKSPSKKSADNKNQYVTNVAIPNP